jgi:homoserine kinase type II
LGALHAALQKALLVRYELGTLHGCHFLARGHVNEKWILETSRGRFLLKRRHPGLQDPALIAGQHALLRFLVEAGFPAPNIVPTCDGATFVETGGHCYEVQGYIVGTPCEEDRPAHLAAAAHMLGRYHGAVRGFDHALLHRPVARYGAETLQRIVAGRVRAWRAAGLLHLEPEIGALLRRVDDLVAGLADLGPLPELVIHGDYYADNLLFCDDRIVGVVDYDLAHWAPRAVEVAEALIYFARERSRRFRAIVYPGVLDLVLACDFVRAYLEIAPLAESEICALPHLVCTIWLCASLEPPLGPPPGPEVASLVLPEVLALVGWMERHAAGLIEQCWRVHRALPRSGL